MPARGGLGRCETREGYCCPGWCGGGGECLADGQNAALGCTLTGPVGGPSVLDCPRADVEDGRSVLRGGVGGGMGVEAAVQSRR